MSRGAESSSGTLVTEFTQCAKSIAAAYGDKVGGPSRGVYIDYGFLIAYDSFFAPACRLAARGPAKAKWKL